MSGDEPSRKAERFSYYARLSKAAQRIYDASDAVGSVDLSDTGPPREAHRDLVEQLLREDRRGAARAAQRLAHAICDTCRVPRLLVKVLSRRPKDETSELHGLYVREEAAVAVISVWMRTAERHQVVKPRTFVRTLLHELVHHLDYELLKLKDSFHTRGFYRREASLFRQLALGPGDRDDPTGPPLGSTGKLLPGPSERQRRKLRPVPTGTADLSRAGSPVNGPAARVFAEGHGRNWLADSTGKPVERPQPPRARAHSNQEPPRQLSLFESR